nr:hypothetical protein [Spirochaeta sp.]
PPTEPDPNAEPLDDGPFARHARMFEYLMNLAGSLPPDRDEEYRQSEERLKLAGVHARLSGHDTLHHKLETARAHEPSPAKPSQSGAAKAADVGTKSIASTFDYLSGLSTHLPDQEIAEQLQSRARGISQRLQ